MFAQALQAAPASDPLIVQLAPYIVAVVTVIGSACTVALTRRGGHTAWLRDQRREAYTAVVSDVHSAAEALADLLFDHAVPDAARAAYERLRATAIACDLHVAALQLLAPEKTWRLGYDLFTLINDLVPRLGRPGILLEERARWPDGTGFGNWPTGARINAALDTFITAAKRDLKSIRP